MPVQTRPRRHPEKVIEAEIVRNLRTLGFGVTKTSQPQRARGVTLGVPDLYASHERWRLRLWIEVKAGDNRPSPAQLAWHAQERASGGTVVVAWSWSDVQRELAVMGAPLPPPSSPPSSARSASAGVGRGASSRSARASR